MPATWSTATDNGVASGAGASAGEHGTAVGDHSYASDNSQAIGASSQATADSTAVGNGSRADWNSIAVGNDSSATGKGSTALGNNSSVTVDGGVALGEGSVSNTPAENYGWDPVTKTQATPDDKGTDPVWFSNRGAVSVGISDADGNPIETRQITNVAAGTADSDAVNVAQLKSAVSAAEGHYYSWNDKDDHQPNYKNDGATGNRALAAGVGASAAGDGATSVGNYTNASGKQSIAIGGTKQNDDGTIQYVQTPKMVQKIDPDTNQPVVDSNGDPVMVVAKDADGNTIYVNKLDDNGNPIPFNTEAYGQDSIAVGTNAKAWADNGIAVGADSQATKQGAAFGYKSNVYGQDGTAVGTQSGASTNATAVGISTSAYGESATAVGKGSGASSNATAVGLSASAWGSSSTAVGQSSGAGYNSAAVGYQASAYGSSAAAVGNGAGAGNNGTAVGNYAGGTGQYATGVGYKASGSSYESTAVGNNVTASGSNTTTVGNYSSAGGSNSTAIGSYSGAANSNSTAVGYHATANNGSGSGGATSVGYYADSNGEGSTSLGYYSNAGYEATAVGYYANANSQYATAVGHAQANSTSATGVGEQAKANSYASTAVGYQTNTGYEATAVGYQANASNNYSTAVGYEASASSYNATAVGHANASSNNATAVGEVADASNSSATAVGNYSHANGSYSTAIGNSSYASSYESTAAGYNAHASNSYATALGFNANASTQYSTAVGNANSSGDYATAVGYSANAHGYEGTALGYNANASGSQASALGFGSNANGSNSSAIGFQANASGSNTSAVGFQAGATGNNTTAVGFQSGSSGSNTTAVGYQAKATNDSTTAVGNNAAATGSYATAIGYHNGAYGSSSVSIGNVTNAWGTNAVGLGTNAHSGNDAVAIGTSANAYDNDAVAISSGASAGKYAVSVGKNANAWRDDSIVFGYNSKSGSEHGIMGWDPLSANIGQDYTTPTWTSTNNAVSFGRAEEKDENGNVTLTQITRQINNVAAGTLDTDVVNVAQLKSAIKSFEYNAGKWHDYDVNVPTEEIMSDTNYDNTGAQKGKRAMAAGFSATANGDDSMALGHATANGVESVAIGKGANVIGVRAVGFGANQSIGLSSMAFGQNNIAGTPADANGAYTLQYNGAKQKETVMADAAMHEAYVKDGQTFNVTFKTEDKADQHLLVLRTNDASGNKPVVLASDGKLYNVTWDGTKYVQGDEATDLTTDNLVTHNYNTDGGTFTGAYSTAFGKDNVASGTASLAFGGEAIKANGPTGNKASGVNSVAFGNSTEASGQDTVAFGDGAKASNDEAVAFGQRTTASAARATAFGESSTASGQTATAFGYHTTASGTGATALGNKSEASGMYAMAWGGGDRVIGKDENGKDIKTGPIASGLYSTAFGSGTQATADNATAFGELSNATAKNATAFGKSSTASGENTLAALGGTAEGANSTAIGVGAAAKLDGSIALGDGALANTAAGKEGYDPLGTGYVSTDESEAWKSTKNALSVGDVANNVTRQITGVAAGTEDTDAVNVAQLKKMGEYASKHTLVTVNETKTEAPKDDKGAYTDEYDTANGNLNIRAKTTDGQTSFNIKLNDQIGLGQKGEPGKDGKDGVDGQVGVNGKDGTTIIIGKDAIPGEKGEDGQPGKDGINGISIRGEDGQDGKSGVTIIGPQGENGRDGLNGIDGHIGISGKDGKDAVAINGKDGIGTIGLAGKDGKDGISVTTIRTEYVTKPGVDGQDGKDGITRIIYQDPDGKDHDVATLDDGLKFTGNNSSTINHNKLDTTVHVIGEGTGSDLTNFKSAGGNIAVEANGKDDNDSTLTIKLNKDVNLGNDGSLTVGGDTNNTNPIVIKHYNDGDLTDNKGNTVTSGDYITGLDNRTWNINDPTYVSGRAATEDELKQAGDQIVNKITNTTEGGGFGLADDKGGKVSQDLGTNIQVIGDGKRTYVTKLDDNGNPVKDKDGKEVKVLKDVTDSNITTTVVDLEDGTKAVKVALSDNVNVGGNDGKDGKIGVNGKDGKNGNNGKDAVSISASDGQDGVNGKDGHIGMTGTRGVDGRDGRDGTDGKVVGADITVRNGHNGLDGTDGNNGKDGMTRVVYEDNNKVVHEVATLDDGLKFTGNNNETVNHNKLNTTVNVVGEGSYTSKTENGQNTLTYKDADGNEKTFTSAENNIAVVANGGDDDNSTLTVKLNKDVNLGSDGSLTVGGDTKNGDSIVIKNHQDGDLKDNKGGDVKGGDYITGLDNRTWNVDDPTYVSGRAATEDELKQAGDQINTKIDNIKTDITNADKGGGFGLQDEHTGKVSQNLGTNIQIIGDGDRTYKDDGKGGKVIDKVENSNITTTVVDLEDGTKAVEVALSDNVNLGGKGKDGKDGVDGSIGINGKDGKSGVGIDGKDGISMVGEAGKNGISIKGDDGKDGKDGISIKGPSGKDGDNGHIGISGKDGKDAVALDGKDGVGHIGLTGPAGKDGKNASADITVKSGANGVDGTDGHNGKDGMDRITYVDHNEVTHEVATTDDGLRFTGNNTDTENKHKLNTLVKVQGEGTGKDLSTFKSAAGNIAVEADGKDTLTIKLNKDLTNLNSVTTNNAYIGGNTIINNNGITTNKVVVGNTTVTNNSITVKGDTNIDVGGNQIHNVKAGTAPTDAVNVSQLGESNVTMSNRINRLGDQIDRVGAHASAMAALHPLDFDPDEKLDFAAGFGNYKGEHAAAIGAFYRPNEDTMFSVGGSVGGGDNMVNVGVSFKLGQHNHVSVSRVALAKEVLELRKELENVKSYLADQAAGNTLDLSKIQLFPDTPENHWAYDYVTTMAGNGVLEGYPDGYFKGNRNMTRYEMATVLYRMMQNGVKLSTKALTEFAPELDRIRVDTITKDDRGIPHIQRVRTVKGRE